MQKLYIVTAMSESNSQLKRRVGALVGWIESRARIPPTERALISFPDAVRLAVCTGVTEAATAMTDVLYNPVWVPGEVLFLDRAGKCLVTPRTPGQPGTFEYFDIRELRKAIDCSKRVVSSQRAH